LKPLSLSKGDSGMNRETRRDIDRVHVGTSGWIYRHWRGVFYPADLPVKKWFAFYSRRFETVEINKTFYRLPQPIVFAEWRRQSPPGFVYAVKATGFSRNARN
jgi:uncharacterized protein YecE (DUF72 family)